MSEVEREGDSAATVAAAGAAPAQRIEIVGERRRAHDATFRARVVAEAMAPGASVQAMARHYGLCTSLIHRWRRMALPQVGAASAVQLVPVRVAKSQVPADRAAPARPSSASPTIEIELIDGVRVRVGSDVSQAALRQ